VTITDAEEKEESRALVWHGGHSVDCSVQL